MCFGREVQGVGRLETLAEGRACESAWRGEHTGFGRARWGVH